MVKDQRYRSAYIFGAVCPARDTGAALVLTHVSVAAMNLLLEEVASQLPPGTHAAMLIDNAGWHTANDLRVPLRSCPIAWCRSDDSWRVGPPVRLSRRTG